MTNKAMSLALALAVVLALGMTTTAQAAPRLSLKEAKRLAVKLGKKQVRENEVKVFHLGRARRLGRSAIAFPYDARTRADTYCTATLRVRKRQRGRRISTTAAIGRQSCERMTGDVLAFESATRKAVRAIRVRLTRRSVARVDRSVARCEEVEVPRSRRSAVRAIVDVAIVNALVRPNRRALVRFLERLDAIETPSAVLGRGVAAWEDYFDVVESQPPITYPCATIRRWRDEGWAWDEAPLDMDAYRRHSARAQADGRALRRASRRLEREGVYPRLARAFRPYRLLLYIAE